MRDHRGEGKIERLIRMINERLRTNKQIIVTKDQSGLSEILYALRVNKKKDGTSPFEKQMGRQPNTVKSNLVSKLLAISEQDPNLEFEQSDFQDDLDSTVLVRERARGSKLQGTFDKRAGRKIKETSGRPKTYANRDIAIASKEQKEVFGRAKSEKKRVLSTTESDGSEIIIQRKKTQKKKKKATPEMVVDPYAEDESIPKIIDIATSSTEAETTKQAGPEQKHKEEAGEGMMQKPQESAIPIVATTKWETANKEPVPPTRVIERVRVPTKRYGIDLVQKDIPEEN